MEYRAKHYSVEEDECCNSYAEWRAVCDSNAATMLEISDEAEFQAVKGMLLNDSREEIEIAIDATGTVAPRYNILLYSKKPRYNMHAPT